MPSGCQYLLPSITGGEVNTEAMTAKEESERFRKTLINANLTKEIRENGKIKNIPRYTCHSARHTFAYWAACCGVDRVEIQNAGRWASFSAFQTYIDMGKNTLATRVQNSVCNPFKGIWEWKNPQPQFSDCFVTKPNQLFSGGQVSNRYTAIVNTREERCLTDKQIEQGHVIGRSEFREVFQVIESFKQNFQHPWISLFKPDTTSSTTNKFSSNTIQSRNGSNYSQPLQQSCEIHQMAEHPDAPQTTEAFSDAPQTTEAFSDEHPHDISQATEESAANSMRDSPDILHNAEHSNFEASVETVVTISAPIGVRLNIIQPQSDETSNINTDDSINGTGDIAENVLSSIKTLEQLIKSCTVGLPPDGTLLRNYVTSTESGRVVKSYYLKVYDYFKNDLNESVEEYMKEFPPSRKRPYMSLRSVYSAITKKKRTE